MLENDFRFYEFGAFRLDARRRILTRHGEKVPLTPRNFDLLFYLVRNEGRIIEHDEILDRVWEGMFVEQSNLKKGISALRQILGESATEGEFIKTIPRRGYSFVAPVRARADEPEAVVARETEIAVERRETELTVEEIEIFDEEAANDAENIEIIALPAAEKQSSLVSAKNRRYFAAAMILLTLSAGAFFAWRFFARRASALDLSRMQIVPLTNLGNVGISSISQNGDFLCFGVSEKGLSSLWLKHLRTGKVTELVPPQKTRFYASDFAPGDQSVYYWMVDENAQHRSGVYKIGIAGGEPQKISDKSWAGLKFSPDGSRIAYLRRSINEQNENGIFTANPDASDEKLVFIYSGATNVLNFDWSPDGRFFVFTASKTLSNQQKQYYIGQVPAIGGAEQIIVPPRPQPIFSASWFPDQKGLAVTALDEKTGYQQIWYLNYPAGDWQRITTDLNWYWAARPTAGATGIVVVQQRDLFNLWVGDRDGQNFRQITSDTLLYHQDPSWLDDDTILFAAKTESNFDVWTMTADGKNRRQLTFEPSSDRYARATPGGKRILFLSNRSGVTQVWQMNADGGDLKQITNAAGDVGYFKILPDGQTIVYSSLANQSWSLFKKPIDAPEFQALPFSNLGEWNLSPDGTLVSYTVQTKNGERLRISTLEENRLIRELEINDFDAHVWSADGKFILYDNYYNDRDEIMMQPIEGGAPRPVTNFKSDDFIWRFDLSPNGNRIVMRRARQFLDIMQIKLDPNL